MTESARSSKSLSPRAVIERFSEEIVNKGNFDLLSELVDENVRFETTLSGISPGRDGVKELFSDLHKAFSNVACGIQQLLVEDDFVAERFIFSGTHTGDFRGIKPTNKWVKMNGMAFFQVFDGRIIARWGVEDHLQMMRQIGALPIQTTGE